MNKLKGKVAVVTGAARGQGRSHAVRLAEEGADIIAIDICRQIDSVRYPMATASDLAETVVLVEAFDRRVVSAEADVRNHAALTNAVEAGVAQLGRLDIVSANAGIASYAEALDVTVDMWDDMIAVNLTGVWNTVQACLPSILAGGRGGSIVITSSTAGLHARANMAHYATAKTGLIGLTRALALEFGQFGVRVNAVHPGAVNTPMVVNDVTKAVFLPGRNAPSDAELMDAMSTINVLPTPWVEPVDISNAVVYLASDDARYVTGSSLVVDAGNLLR